MGAPKAKIVRTVDEVESFLKDEIGEMVKLAPAEVDPTREFSDFGLDSRQGVALSGALEKFLEKRLSATLVWDYPTIETLAKHLGA